MRIGAVNYLNSKPLIHGLDEATPNDRLLFDLPSRLADSLSAGRLDVALVPSVEWLRQPGHVIVSDACIACRGPVLSVKMYFRKPPREVRTLALDEGSRTSAALAQILLEELSGVRPETEPLPIGCGMEQTQADAVLLIGDRAILSADQDALETWDLGQKWVEWTGLPFVFAAWVARPEVETAEIEARLSAARDRGVSRLREIAAAEAPLLGIDTELALRYFRDNLHFTFGREEFAGLGRFARLCARRGLVPKDADRAVALMTPYGCSKQ
ncbi:MAG: menaquinone biosynthetic enzyme MqnA/MqnD family protein [Pirellulales bacterium]